MRAQIKRGVAAAAAILAATATLVAASPSDSRAAAAPSLRAFGISSDGTIMSTFTTDKPDTLDWFRAIKGLSGDTAALGIDFRVQDGLMYLVGNKGGIYTVKTPPSVPDVTVTKVSQLTVPLYGTNFGVDFNPAADRLRITSDTGQNLRHNLGDHRTVEDAVLSTPPDLGPTRGVTASAYTNNDLNADTATTLFGIGTNTDQVLIQSPANNGLLAPTGALGVDAGANAGFDIFSTLTNGKTTAVTGFATLTPAGAATSSLYGINLLSGTATAIGQFPIAITDIAITLTGTY